MTYPEPTTDPRSRERSRRSLVRRAVACVVATAMALTVSLVLVPTLDSEGAPRFNVRCDELIEGIEGVADLADLPGGGLPSGHTETIADYEYENPATHLSDEKQPSAAELKKLKGSHKKFPIGSRDRMIRSWKRYKGAYSWEQWRNTYIPNQANDARGDAFHGNAARRLKLGGGDWMCEDTKLAKEEKLGSKRRYDSVNRQHRIAYEVKSGNSRLSPSQLKADAALRARGWRVVYIFSKEPTTSQLNAMRKHNIEHASLRSTAVQKNPPKSSGNAMNPPCTGSKQPATMSTLAAGCPRRSTAGPAKDLAQRSGRTPALAREGQRLQDSLGADGRRRGFMPARPGGIDWTSLELKYVSDDPGADDHGYAFSADELPEDAEDLGYGGEAALDLSSDALFTWLALDPNQFWVNLNPDTPETIIDDQFASTDAGRVLLQADLEFKRTIADGMNPDTELGEEFWDSMERTEDGMICHDWYRFWVDPKPAKVRQSGGELYILDAPLRAQIEPVEVDWEMPGDDQCADAPEDVVERNNQRIADTYAPHLEEAVNNDPEYADLRRVYTARVAAEWIKDRDAKRPGAYHDVIGSGDVSAWPARTEWDPQEVFDAYLERLQTPLYRYEYEHGDMEYWMEITGGVEFPDAPRDQTPKAEFERDHPKLPRTARSARHEAVSLPLAAQDDTVGTLDEGAESTAWLGGGTVQEAEEPDPDPTDPPGDGDDDGNDGGGEGPGGGDDGGSGDGSGRGDDGSGGGSSDDDAPGSGGREPLPPRADSPSVDVVPGSGPMPATGFSDAWMIPTALVLVLGGLALVLLRRRWSRGL